MELFMCSSTYQLLQPMGTVSPVTYCSPSTSQRQSDSCTHAPSWEYGWAWIIMVWLLYMCVCLCRAIPPTCWTVPCGHWQPGVQFLLRFIVRSVHDTAPLTHWFHSWAGGHISSPANKQSSSQKYEYTYFFWCLVFLKTEYQSLFHQHNTYTNQA